MFSKVHILNGVSWINVYSGVLTYYQAFIKCIP